MSNLIEETEATQRVVEHRGGPLLVLGGPGTGKTRLIEQRYLRLATAGGVPPHRILILAANRAYSMEAKDRLVWALPHQASIEIPVYTWHALAHHLVTRHYPKLGHREPPVLLTGPEQWGVVRELLAAEPKLDWPVWGERLIERGFVDEVADFVLRVQQKLMTEADLAALAEQRPGWAEVIRFYSRYRDYLKEESRLDYAGLIASAVDLLSRDDEVAGVLRKRFPHVLVDNGQELSHAHRELLRCLQTSELVVAADPDSGIETFRGAEPDWVFGFEGWFGPHETVTLQQSHRLGSPALDAALGLIAHNDPDAGHRCKPGPGHETVFESRMYSSTAEEVEAIARELRHIHLRDGVEWGRMAVLISQPHQILSPLQRALGRWEVPYLQKSGERPLSAQPAVASFLDLVRVALQAEGWEAILPGLLTRPLAGLDYTQRRRLERAAWQQRRSLASMVEEAEETAEFRRLRDLVAAHRDRADECFWQVYTASEYCRGLVAAAIADPADTANEDLDALVAFSHALGRFVERRRGRGSISDYLAEAARADFGADPWLPPAAAGDPGRVSLLSFHAAAGQQWHTVFVAGCLDAWIPKGRRAQGLFDPFSLEIADVADREVEAIADDRRTFYVAATRASHRTVFTVSPGASGRGRPTRFLAELGVAPAEFESPAELPPLTEPEMAARLHKTVKTESAPGEEKVAALVALSQIPGVDPSRWYGRWDWTEGAVPLATRGEFRTSYSRLGVYDNCGLQYLMQSVLGLDPSSTESMKFGTWIHALFQAVHDGLISDPATLRAEYHSIFDETVFPNRAIANQYRRDGEKMLKVFWEHEFKQDNVLTEQSFEFPYEGAVLRGRIDRIDRLGGRYLKLTDYKTAKWAASGPEAARSLQLAIYFLAARTDPALRELGEPQVARLVYPGSTWPDGRPKEPSQNADQAAAVLEQLPQLISDVLDEKFSPSPEADCHFCRMKPLCPLWPEGREVQA
jgi:superfamily I DNA/RNA helicase/RecB family exonuclease